MEVHQPSRAHGAFLFLAIFALYLAAPAAQIRDARYITAVSHAFLHTGSLAITDEFESGQSSYQLVRTGDQRRYFFSEAPAVLNAPFVLLFEWAGVSPINEENKLNRRGEGRILKWIAALLASATCWILFRLGAVYLSTGPVLGLVLVYAAGTSMFSTVSRPYWSHSWTVLLIAVSLLFVVPAGRAVRASWVAAAASCSMWAFFCRPAVAPMVLAIGVLVALGSWRTSWRPIAAYGGTCIGWLMLLTIYSRSAFDAWLPPYFLSAHVESGRWLGGSMLDNYFEAALGSMVSPGRGLLIYMPIVLVTLMLAAVYWKSLPSRAVAVVSLAVVFVHWQVIASFRNWWGGESYGPRLFSDAIPWLFLLSALALAATLSAWRERPPRFVRASSFAMAVVIAFSIFVHARGAMDHNTIYWGRDVSRIRHLSRRQRQRLFIEQRLWNWRYPQFVSGLVNEPRIVIPEHWRKKGQQ